MISKELIDRINYLSRKSRAEGLTPEEKAEQQEVRQQYLAGIRARVQDTLDHVEWVDEEPKQVAAPCSCPSCHGKSHHKHKH